MQPTLAKSPSSPNDVMSVSSLNHAIKLSIEPQFQMIRVQGEVTNYRLQASGHEYFSLKDEKSQISCVFFKGFRSKNPLQIRPGDQIIVEGDLSLYEVRGTYQIVIKRAKKAGVGDLLAKIHELKKELEGLGWLDPAQKKPLPKFPKTIGVITSPTGSVIRDIIHVLERRYAGFQLILNPVRVQGVEAANEIAEAIATMNDHQLADILIVGRGGGSLEDLMPFNERVVATAIHESQIPIISAVGHETDVSIADFVADYRAPTPSAAAEIAIREKGALLDRLQLISQTLTRNLREKIQGAKQLVRAAQMSPALRDPAYLLGHFMQKMDDMTTNIEGVMRQRMEMRSLHLQALIQKREGLNPFRQIQAHQERIRQFESRIDRAIQVLVAHEEKKLASASQLIHSINPKKLLSRGYCIPFAQNQDSVIISTNQLAPKDRLRLLMSDGEVISTVEEIQRDQRQ